ncbi:AbfB domain-containing protein [Streptomyces sp. Ag109_G2-15]|uniref:AbfB domain-containing protein n=1 Tax=Streptomyces sp. Ag109_G2-15 TaxID=1938850 RepID=UPI000BCF2DF1|nr:AbfB domain-containing protein [Streptomyces sp. Ag109_G2-15]SOD87419.1 Alpha-L-arabinofuranosidase B (ABFB) domain-containing protein [Streptomyces sp. Ag109_G2-15]
MPESTPHSPRRQPWENGWTPDTSRAPGTRRLWLAGALAVATIAACVTAIAVNDRTHDQQATPPATGAPTDNGPGLLSFASPSTSTTAPPKGNTSMTSPTPSTTASPTPTHTADAKPTPAKSPAHHGSSRKPATDRRSIQSLNYPDRYWHVVGDYVKLDPVDSPSARRAATFTLVKGLSDARCYSFATADGDYLRHRNFLLRAEHNDGSRLFRQDATFCPRTSSVTGATMLESVNYPGRFLRHQNFQLKLDPYQNTDLYRADSAFRLVDGLA